MIRTIAAVLLLAALSGSGFARERGDPQDSEPIIEGQPDIRVSPSGDVIAPKDDVAKRDLNGKVKLRQGRRMEPGAAEPGAATQ